MAVSRSKDTAETMRRPGWPSRSRAREHEINHPRKRTTMRKLIESTLVSLDGVIEAPERWASLPRTMISRCHKSMSLGWVSCGS